MVRLSVLAFALLAFPAAVFAACDGDDWRATLPPETVEEVRAAVADVPFGEGIAFEAVRGGSRITLFGTVHSADPAIFVPKEIATRVRAAHQVFVEATAKTERDIGRYLRSDPSLRFNVAGPGLSARLSAAEWQELREALAAYGVDAQTADRMRPWFAAVTLETPLCELAAEHAGSDVLDKQVERLARTAGVAVAALDEDYESLLAFYLDASAQQELDMLRLYLATGVAEQSTVEDTFATAIGAWRDEEILTFWELSRTLAASSSDDGEAVAALFRRMHASLIVMRNRAWVARILGRVPSAPDIVVAAGALHLPGEHGLPRLLEEEGYAVSRLTVF